SFAALPPVPSHCSSLHDALPISSGTSQACAEHGEGPDGAHSDPDRPRRCGSVGRSALMTTDSSSTVKPVKSPGGDASAPRPGKVQRARANPLRFLSRRLGFYLFTAWAAITLNFLIPRFVPGDPAQDLLQNIRQQTGQTPTPDQIAAIQTFYGDPSENLLGQYLQYWVDIANFRFGTSLSEFPTPVSELVGQALPWTVLLVGATTLISWVIGTFLG